MVDWESEGTLELCMHCNEMKVPSFMLFAPSLYLTWSKIWLSEVFFLGPKMATFSDDEIPNENDPSEAHSRLLLKFHPFLPVK